MAAKRSLLEDSDDDGADGGNIGADFKINEAFARRLEHNKKREDLHRLQELQKRGLADSETDSDDDDDEDEDGLLPESTEVQILDTLARIKKKDPVIYKSDVKFFEEGEDVEENAGRNEEPKKKPVYLKDVIARQALEDPENKEEEEVLKRRLPKTYAEEQQELKDAFLKSVSEADAADGEGEAGLFKIRKKSTEEEQYRADGDGEQKKKDAVISHRLEEYFGKDDDLDEHDKFLKDYLLNQGWIDKEKGEATFVF